MGVLGVGHPAEVVGRDVSFLSVSLSQPPLLVTSQVTELKDANVLVLLQGQFLFASGLKCIHGIILWKQTQFRCEQRQMQLSLLKCVKSKKLRFNPKT